MNKSCRASVWFVLAGLLMACVSAPDPRPDVQIEAERKLQQGVSAFHAEHYPSAAALFSGALSLYRSVDDQTGITQSLINLAETALLVGHYVQAEEQLLMAEKQALSHGLVDEAARITLLFASLDYRRGDYSRCAERLKELLPGFTPDATPEGEITTLTRVAIADRTRVSFKLDADAPSLWTRRFEAALRQTTPDELMLARLERFQAELARRRGEAGLANTLLGSALHRYKALAHRRGIAATLSEQARLASDRQDYAQADDLLRRSLQVRIWSLDRQGAVAALEALIRVNEKLGREENMAELRIWLDRVSRSDFVAWERLKSDPYMRLR